MHSLSTHCTRRGIFNHTRMHSLRTHYNRRGIFNHSRMHSLSTHYSQRILSITTACHSFSKRSLYSAGYYNHNSMPFILQIFINPSGYFQSQQHAIHSPNAHYTRRGIFNHNSMPFILQTLITHGGVFSITTACHSFFNYSLHPLGYFQSQQHAIHSPNTHYTRWGIFNHNSMPFSKRSLKTLHIRNYIFRS
jgi:hypothetical protein